MLLGFPFLILDLDSSTDMFETTLTGSSSLKSCGHEGPKVDQTIPHTASEAFDLDVLIPRKNGRLFFFFPLTTLGQPCSSAKSGCIRLGQNLVPFQASLSCQAKRSRGQLD